MRYLTVSIMKVIDEGFPGWVECLLKDANGRTWTFHEKIPVVTAEDIWTDSCFPIRGVVGCEVTGRKTDSLGRAILTVDSRTPWGIESIEGNTIFDVFAEQIKEEPDGFPTRK